jgi:hypothetical protein
MPRAPRSTSSLTTELQAFGVTAGGVLAKRLNVSASTLSRLVAQVGAQIEKIGAARATRYALRRKIGMLGGEWPVYRVSPEGRIYAWGSLRALHGGFRFLPADPEHPLNAIFRKTDGVTDGLPFFLHDARPQGFLGRSVARNFAATMLNVPQDLERWSDDHVISYFLQRGEDLPGDIIVGDSAMEAAHRLLQRSIEPPTEVDDRRELYPLLADSAHRGEVVGSSAGGEQPKFVSSVRTSEGNVRKVLVKFSPPMTSQSALRWADLLACEFLALQTLRRHGVSAVSAEILSAGDRCFLEVERFDRTAEGRRGLLSLGVVEDEFLVGSAVNAAPGGMSDWADLARSLASARIIDEQSARTLMWIWCFGTLIGNTDMHRANTCFWFGESPLLQLAPVYDMLPMMYAPNRHGEIPVIDFLPRPPRSSVAHVWSSAAAAAEEFWGAAASSNLISDGFRQIASANLQAVSALCAKYRRAGEQ